MSTSGGGGCASCRSGTSGSSEVGPNEITVGRSLAELFSRDFRSVSVETDKEFTLGSRLNPDAEFSGPSFFWQGTSRGMIDESTGGSVSTRLFLALPADAHLPRPAVVAVQRMLPIGGSVVAFPFRAETLSQTMHFGMNLSGNRHDLIELDPNDLADNGVDGAVSDESANESSCKCKGVWISEFGFNAGMPPKPREERDIPEEERTGGVSGSAIGHSGTVRGRVQDQSGKEQGFDFAIVVEGDKKSKYEWAVTVENLFEPGTVPLVISSSSPRRTAKKTTFGQVISGENTCPNGVLIQLMPNSSTADEKRDRKPRLQDQVLVVGWVNGVRCGAVLIRYTNSDLKTLSTVVLGSARIDDNKKLAVVLEGFFKSVGLKMGSASGTNATACELCRKIDYIGHPPAKGSNSRNNEIDPDKIASAVEQVRKSISEGISTGDISGSGKEGRFSGRFKSLSGLTEPIQVEIQFPSSETKNADIAVPTVNEKTSKDVECPPPAIVIAFAGNGTKESPDGGTATAVAPWTGCAIAVAGDGYSLWKMSDHDEKQIRNVGGRTANLKGPDGSSRGLTDKIAQPGDGGDARAVGGSAIAIGGNGGNGKTSGGDGGKASVGDRMAPECCSGFGAGVAMGGHGGSACDGDGGNGGDAETTSLDGDVEKSDVKASDDAMKEKIRKCQSQKAAIGGNGGYGIKLIAKGGNTESARGGDGGNATVVNGMKGGAKGENDQQAVGGRGGSGSAGEGNPNYQSGGDGGDVSGRQSEEAGSEARGSEVGKAEEYPHRVPGEGGDRNNGQTQGGSRGKGGGPVWNGYKPPVEGGQNDGGLDGPFKKYGCPD